MISNIDFALMSFAYKIGNLFRNSSGLLDELDIKKDYTVIDYGCGPGRHIKKASALVGDSGIVHAVDIHKIAIKSIRKLIRKENLKNVIPVFADGYSTIIESDTADIIYALDMFHQVKHPVPFLEELCRLAKDSGLLIIDDGRQPREKAKKKIQTSNLWEIVE